MPQLYSLVPLLRAAEISSNAGRPAAIGAFNANFFAQAEGEIRGGMYSHAPIIIQASRGANNFQGGPDKIEAMVRKAMARFRDVICCLHLDHGTETSAIDCVDKNFSSVMNDASELKFEENVASVARVVQHAHAKGVSVEAELGALAGVEEDIAHEKSRYTKPEEVPELVRRTKADAVAVAYGTSHGAFKGKTTMLNIDIVTRSYLLLRVNNLNLDHFLVGHGSSTVPDDVVQLVNHYGGCLSETSGVPEEKIQEAIKEGIRKVNIDTDLRLRMTGVMRRYCMEKPDAVKSSQALALVSDILSGRTLAYDKDGKLVPAGKITDPRSWLDPVQQRWPEVLREDYRRSEDKAFIQVMTEISNAVAYDVAKLCTLFGAAGLHSAVNTSLTLEEMAKHYAGN
jgi:fructose-bisphosphate aldolase class II